MNQYDKLHFESVENTTKDVFDRVWEVREAAKQAKQDEALLRQALEALDYVGQNTPKFVCGPGMDGIVTALRERLK